MTRTCKEYIDKHPLLWKQFENITLQTIAKGHSHYGSKGIFEVIRWHRSGAIFEDGFKINNNYAPEFGDYFEMKHPEHKGFFRTRVRMANNEKL